MVVKSFTKQAWFLNIILLSSAHAMNKSEFKLVNNIVMNGFVQKESEKLNVKCKLKEYWESYGGHMRVDSAWLVPGEKNKVVITLTGAVAEQDNMHMNGYALMACHEACHVAGGAPYQTKALTKGLSVEGQADYCATKKCMWEYVKDAQTTDVIHNLSTESIRLCERAYPQEQEFYNCLRILSGILDIERYFNLKNPGKVSIFAKDESVVDKTLVKYPSDQCRMDTMMAGLLSQPRPACWYKDDKID